MPSDSGIWISIFRKIYYFRIEYPIFLQGVIWDRIKDFVPASRVHIHVYITAPYFIGSRD